MSPGGNAALLTPSFWPCETQNGETSPANWDFGFTEVWDNKFVLFSVT